MKNILTTLLLLFITTSVLSQEDGRVLLRGQVLYRNNFVQNENVVNINTEKATITNKDGEFAIFVKAGDELVFSAVNYKIKSVIIDDKILKNNRLVVEVNEKVTQLEEVVVTPENEKKFLELKNEEFKQYDYESDPSTPTINDAIPVAERGLQNGLNFVNIFKAIFKSKKEETTEQREIRMSEVLRQIYEDEFFVGNLKIPSEKIEDFLYFCDSKMPAQSLLKKDNEFQLIDFLVNQSEAYLKIINSEE
ncbi:hypothetical protein GWK08_03215 [Leptobacterium flavescens]|uniref:Carboxypeptidase-like regulatory domain-containing protein n=1 Tax=Leptobacterium flavescens TaxID=472055 RepID=A0A6P0UHF7_9FLAO|nr:carboxypeptidase-like regulatory domain-containing protein [Leptobacterium flavescens]NER12437.1 hypothetical protein [Leptobacterium flavescens]